MAVLAGVVAVTLGLARPQTGPIVPLAGTAGAPLPVADLIAMKLKGSAQGEIKGSLAADSFKDQIEILGIEHERSAIAATTGLGNEEDPALILTKRADAASVNLYKAMFTGELLTAEIVLHQDLGSLDFLELKMDKVRIESISQSHEPGKPGSEVVKLRYRSAVISFKPDQDVFELPAN